ncbi:Bud13 domain-containing protein [Cephalotus follicularis]|uniref:Bud13 domain-containing protein n=1 Tax=Cephalotus follicularis TaxID=3775 RepID=A0A1Q3B2V0_CEPFO|nr:Bud13 domain-containing protein [Cephalotus follicularis]
MATSTRGGSSLKEYLKRYESTSNEEDKKKKKKKKSKSVVAQAILVVDEDPVWQKPINLEEEKDDDSPDEKPQVNEDIEVRRMKRLEQLRLRRPFGATAEDGSGWVSLSGNNPNNSPSHNANVDVSPPRRQITRNDTPSPGREDNNLVPPRHRKRNDSPSPEAGRKPTHFADISPPRRRRIRNDTPSPRSELKTARENTDLSPPRQTWRPHYSPSSKRELNSDLSPPRKQRARNDTPSPEPDFNSARVFKDLSPPRQRRKIYDRSSPEPDRKPLPSAGLSSDISPPCQSRPRTSEDLPDISPPRRARRVSPYQYNKHSFPESDLSPPRKSRTEVGKHSSLDLSPPRKHQKESSVPANVKEQPKTGLVTGRDVAEEISRTKKKELLRFQKMDPSMSGRGAEPVFRDKIKGGRISKDEYLKSKHKKEETPKAKELEWGKGLAQKREAEARLQELELEKDKPFARSRDDPELDKMLKERLRWGDPMAHLVQRKYNESVTADLGDNERMKESGFIIPQEIPSHSWIKRGLEAAPNRYGIRSGRHWDGVDRSTGYEKTLFKRRNEKQATEREAYLWSSSDM